MERKDYYKILGLSEEDKKLGEKEFEAKLKKNYRNLCIQLHPDKQQGKSDEEKKVAEEKLYREILFGWFLSQSRYPQNQQSKQLQENSLLSPKSKKMILTV